MVAPRRAIAMLLGLGAGGVLAFLPFRGQIHDIYLQTVTFQETRWEMDLLPRLETAALYWILASPPAVLGLFRRNRPLWLAGGFLLGGVFLFSSQVYYHYFVPIAPCAALLGGPVLARLGVSWRGLSAAGLAVALAWSAVIDLGGPSPLYITAAHLSDIRPTIDLLDRTTKPDDLILADRFEYAYLSNRRALAHYFWNVGVLVEAGQLERQLPAGRAVVLSHGMSSGYPEGLVSYLNARWQPEAVGVNTVWLTRPRARR